MKERDDESETEKKLDRETDAVMKERVASSTRVGYDGRNVSFIIWLLDSGKKTPGFSTS